MGDDVYQHTGVTASERWRGERLGERLAESGLFASDIGLDGAGASAEEAAMHVIPDSDTY